MRCLLLSLAFAFLAVGCATTKNMTITTRPPDASIKIDGIERGKGKVTAPIIFKDKKDTHVVLVSRMGYKDQTITLKQDYQGETLNVDLKPLTKRVTITVSSVPGKINIDGKPVSNEPMETVTQELEFTVDARNNWTTHTISVERPGYERADRVVSYQDKDATYAIRLEPQKKNLTINTKPQGAQVFLDGEPVGVSPVSVQARPFPVDIATDEVIKQKLRVDKKGYDPIEVLIGWDGGKTDYNVDLLAKTKTVRFIVDPPGSVVTLDGKPLEKGPTGHPSAALQFPPVDAAGNLKTYSAIISKKTADSEWEPQKLTVAWDGGRQDYSVTLKEILTRPVNLLSPTLVRGDDGWTVDPVTTVTLAMKDVTEGAQKEPPQQITRHTRGTQIDTLTISPDGSKLLFTIVQGRDRATFRSLMVLMNTDGSGGATYINDGKSLEITPAFTPGGDQVVFSSNRASRQMKVWAMSAVGAPGITQLSSGETNDLWPCIDSDPKPRLFFQAMVDTRPDPRIYMTQLGTTTRTDMTQLGGSQPRVNPKADAVAFTLVNDKTGKRDIYIMPDRGGAPRNITNTADIDEFDPEWSKDGARLAFVSDAGVDEERRQNLDVWAMDLAKPERPVQITNNGSHDDHPAWDPSGRSIYFRSNRGGEWAIWRIVSK
jgi:hypothetical protein